MFDKLKLVCTVTPCGNNFATEGFLMFNLHPFYPMHIQL